MTEKQELYQLCQDFINHRLKVINKTIEGIEKSFHSETKSSAGDKHETGRAMLQLEREKAGNQLAEVQKLQQILHRIDIKKEHKNIALGSIVITNNINYFISISAGELATESGKFYAISASTPIAKLLISKQKGDLINFRNNHFKILKVY